MGPHASTLSALLGGVPVIEFRGDPSTAVEDLAYDARSAVPGALFFCVPGARSDGHDHAANAVRAGATALVVERMLDLDVAQAHVRSVRDAMGPASSAFYGHPSHALRLAGVTGTNGKTTTALLLERCFQAAGMRSGVIGTVLTRIAGETLPAGRTTPEAPDLQRLLARMRAAGSGGVAMEVSSHGLAQRRVAGTRFACAVFTNLTQDHLDYHDGMEDYFRAKASLFRAGVAEVAVVNVDDEYGRRLREQCEIPVVTYALDRDADVRAEAVALGGDGSSFDIVAGGRRHPARVRLAGRFNVSNALAAVAAFEAMGLGVEAAIEGVEALEGVPGRVERIDEGQDFTVLVDYAHTPDSLENVLRAAREIVAPGARLWCVFGCGGDRDRTKRPLMGRAAAAMADRVVITSDNPRSEDPAAIVAEIEAGATGSDHRVEVDRRAAIGLAIAGAGPGDVVVIAGKGHESGQEFAGRTVPFDDRDEARLALAERGRR